MDLMDPPATAETGAPEDRPESAGRRRARLGAALEAISVLFLLASYRWAHHWGPLADTVVAVWAISWIAGFWYSARGLRWGGRLGAAGFVVGLLMLLLVAGTGIAAAMGANPVGSCGGG
ncbi:MAG TPA: hypothetical protein VEM41_04970 [Actinomycetota bacterium]|nr:hypothetical protein [Actinomycetota bacterium]